MRVGWGVLAVVLCLLFVVIPTVGVSELLLRFWPGRRGWQPVGLNGLFAFLLCLSRRRACCCSPGLVETPVTRVYRLTSGAAGARWLGGVAVGVTHGVRGRDGHLDGWRLSRRRLAVAWASPAALGHRPSAALFRGAGRRRRNPVRGWLMSVPGPRVQHGTRCADHVRRVHRAAPLAARHRGTRALIFLFSLFACCWALRAGQHLGVMGWHWAGTGCWPSVSRCRSPLDAGLPALLVKLLRRGSPFLHGGAQGPEGSCAVRLLRAGLRLVAAARARRGGGARIDMNYTNELR